MRQLIRQREVVPDDWRTADEDPEGASGAVIVPLVRWQTERDHWGALKARLGVRIGPADSVEAIAADLPRLSLVAIEFGGIGEGRGYTHAQLLRRRYHFQGEIRAVGKVQRDQLFYMARCGFDAFELPEGADYAVALTAFNDFTASYQTATDQGLSLHRRGTRA